MWKQLLLALLLTGTALPVTVISSDKLAFEIDDHSSKTSSMLRDMIETGGDNIPLPHASSSDLRLLIPAMNDLKQAQDKATADTRKYDLITKIRFTEVTEINQLVAVLNVANYLSIELVAQAAAWRLATEIDRGLDVAMLVRVLPGELQEMVAKHYTITYRRQMPGISFVPNVSLDDVLEYDSKGVVTSQWGELDFFNRGITNLQGLEKLSQQFPNVTRLSFTNNFIRSIPQSIGLLTKLQQLSIACNHLQSVPKTITLLPNLQVLELRYNLLGQTQHDSIRKLLPTVHVSTT